MPRQRLYESNADRQAAYNERKRQAERERQRLEWEAQQHRAKIQSLVLGRIAEEIGQKSMYYRHFLNDDTNSADNIIARETLRDLAKAIKRMRIM